MTVYREVTEFDFEPWSGARNTWEKIQDAGKEEEFFDALYDLFGGDEYVEETRVNDLLWFEPDFVLDFLGIEED